MDNSINPIGPQGPQGPLENQQTSQSQPAGVGPFAKLFPGAPPKVIQQITSQFVNYTINQMKQEQAQVTEALKKMQQDED